MRHSVVQVRDCAVPHCGIKLRRQLSGSLLRNTPCVNQIGKSVSSFHRSTGPLSVLLSNCLEIWVKGHPRSFKLSPFNRPYTTFYQSVIVTIAISCTIFELFDVQNIVILKSRLGVTQDHWKWHHSIDCIPSVISVIKFIQHAQTSS